jgi:hypothetical protein
MKRHTRVFVPDWRPASEEPRAAILYYLNLSPDVSTDRLSEDISSSDSQDVDSIQWRQNERSSYIDS